MSDYNFKCLIKKWPIDHARNIKICIRVAEGNTYFKVGKDFGLSGNRVSQIYRVMMGKLCEQLFFVPYHEAVNNKLYYKHPDRLKIILSYEKFFNEECNRYR